VLAQLLEPPCTDPYARWCGRGGAARLPPIPITGTFRTWWLRLAVSTHRCKADLAESTDRRGMGGTACSRNAGFGMARGERPPRDAFVACPTAMEASPSTHFVLFAQSILYRGAGIDLVWPQFLAVAVVGGLFFGFAIFRFRSVAARSSCYGSALGVCAQLLPSLLVASPAVAGGVDLDQVFLARLS
jgi:hypothetical protein